MAQRQAKLAAIIPAHYHLDRESSSSANQDFVLYYLLRIQLKIASGSPHCIETIFSVKYPAIPPVKITFCAFSKDQYFINVSVFLSRRTITVTEDFHNAL